jgi:3-oxoacyl-[acyl-carrier protein] reductase
VDYLMQIKDKTIVITGAGRGIGRSLAVRFARHGANLALLDLNGDDLREAAAQCTAFGVRASIYTADVSVEQQVATTLDQVVADFGSLDVIINNAGIVKDAMLLKVKDGKVLSKMSLEQWQAVISVNLTGVFLCAREAADILTTMKPEILQKVIAPVPLGRLGEPDEIAHAAQFIIENDFFTGRCLDLDGGLRL